MQAPIGPATTPELVRAVSQMGALGTLAASWTDPHVLREQIREIAAGRERPFCVNLVLAFDQRDRLEVAMRRQGRTTVHWCIVADRSAQGQRATTAAAADHACGWHAAG